VCGQATATKKNRGASLREGNREHILSLCQLDCSRDCHSNIMT